MIKEARGTIFAFLSIISVSLVFNRCSSDFQSSFEDFDGVVYEISPDAQFSATIAAGEEQNLNLVVDDENTGDYTMKVFRPNPAGSRVNIRFNPEGDNVSCLENSDGTLRLPCDISLKSAGEQLFHLSVEETASFTLIFEAAAP